MERKGTTSPSAQRPLPLPSEQGADVAEDVTDVAEDGCCGRDESIHFEIKSVQLYDVVAGGLREKAGFWESLGASNFILKIISSGYCLPFVNMPDRKYFKNHSSALRHEEFVSETLQGLHDRGCIAQVDDAWICSPLGVVDNGKKLRLILDLRYVNLHLKQFKFKLEGLSTIASVFQQGDFLASFDLKSGYHHIPISLDFVKYLAFRWKVNGVERLYAFTVLPFGLSTAPWVFTKVTRVLLRHWRANGIRCQMYMDDGTVGACTREEAEVVVNHVRNDLCQAGFVVNEEKSCWSPSKKVEVLGTVVDLEKGEMHVSDRRIKKFKACLHALLDMRRPLARSIAKVTGHIASMSFVVGSIARLRTRALYSILDKREGWFSAVEWTAEARDEAWFWVHMIDELNAKAIWGQSPATAVMSWSDASDSGWGGHMTLPGDVQLSAKGDWPADIAEAGKSSTWRELKAVECSLEAFAEHLTNMHCTHRSDNQAAVHIIQYGSKREHLQALALAVHRLCWKHNILLSSEWVPREENALADLLSKTPDTDDWQLHPKVFQSLNELLGPHSLDCFASDRTKQIPRYCSRWWNPGCLAADAFTLSWKGEVVWLCPPLHLVFRVLKMVKSSHCHGTLIVPEWPSAPWWPLLWEGDGWASVVKAAVGLPCQEGLFIPGLCKWNVFTDEAPIWPVWALAVCNVNGLCPVCYSIQTKLQ